jgi:hypothetical protein
VIGTWSFKHKDIAYAALDIDWNDVVRLFNLLELRVDQGLIQVQGQGLLTPAMLGLRTKKTLISTKLWLSTNK